MTMVEEIIEAMEHGASTMFLLGLLVEHKRQPLSMLKAIERAGEAVRGMREVKVQGRGTKEQGTGNRG